jgi:hypothetical protein
MRLSHLMLLLATLLAAFAPAPRGQAVAVPTGHWEGKIQIPEREMAFAVDLAPGAAGAWTGSLSVHGMDVPLTNISVKDGTVQFTAALPGTTSFEGTLSADAATLKGKVSNVEGAVPFELARKGEASVKLPPASSVLSKDFEGTWEGSVERDGKIMRLVLKLSAAPDGTARGLLVSVDKGNIEIPVTTVTIDARQLHLDVRAVAGSYRGTLDAGGTIAGEWAEKVFSLPLTFKRATAAK